MRTLELLLLVQSVFFVLLQKVGCMFIYDGITYPGQLPRNFKRQLSITDFPVLNAPLIDDSNTYSTAGLGYAYPPTLIPYHSQPTITTLRRPKSLPKIIVQNTKRSPTPKPALLKPVVVKPVETYDNFPEFENLKSTIAKEFSDFQQFNFDFGSSPSPSSDVKQTKKEVLLPVKQEAYNTNLKIKYNTGNYEQEKSPELFVPNVQYDEGANPQQIKSQESKRSRDSYSGEITQSRDANSAENNDNQNYNGRYSATNIEEVHSTVGYYNPQPRYYSQNKQNYEVHEHKHEQKHEEKHEEKHGHKHLEKHEHRHKHSEKHGHKHAEKHGHEHKHEEKHGHEHKHKAENKHVHEDIEHHHHEHRHIQHHHHLHKHVGEHKHGHVNKHEHKHEEHGWNDHDHHHKEEHKHGHKHEHKHEHKHGHKEEHKHGHKEEHKHKHENKHSHHHGHEHKHGKYNAGYTSFGSPVIGAPANIHYRTANKASAAIHESSVDTPKTREEYYYRYLGGTKISSDGNEDFESERNEQYSDYAPQSSNISQYDDAEQPMADSSMSDLNVWKPLLNSNPVLKQVNEKPKE